MKFCTLFSGSSGNAVYVEYKNTKIIIDSGVSGKNIAASLCALDVNIKDIDALLLTHDHVDHARCVGIVSNMANAPVYANYGTWLSVQGFTKTMREENKKTFQNNQKFEIGDIIVEPFGISHDATDPVAYNFYLGNEKFTLLTDTGYITADISDKVAGTSAIVLEANHDEDMVKTGMYPAFLKRRILGRQGHLSNDLAGRFLSYLVQNGTKFAYLAHISEENNTPELAYNTVCDILLKNGIKAGRDVELLTCSRYETTHLRGLI